MWSSEKARACMSVALVILVSGIFLVPRLYLAAQMPDTTPQVRIFVISDEELQKHHMHYKAKEVFREVLRINYPAWAEYSQQLTFGKMVVTHDLTTIIWNAGAECAERCPYPISVNPSVLLTVLILKYGEAPPSGFNAHQAVRQIALDIKRLHEEGRTQPEVWQDRFANLGSYVMYRLVGADERRMGEWLTLYRRLVPEACVFQEVTPTATPTVIVPPPFLERPYATATPFPTPTPMGFGYPLNSFFDHRYPIYSSEPEEDQNNLYRFDGSQFADDNEAGKSWYSGHDGIDYGTPLGVPIRAAADGEVVWRDDDCGWIILKHERNGSTLYTEYMHMSAIFVSEGDEVTAGQEIGEAGDVADDITCFSDGAHLHFGVRLYFGSGTSHTNIDPFGWWDGYYSDPWEVGTGEYGGYRSRWLWWGDEAGDGHYTVDDAESQAQLFHPTNWWYAPNGYNGGAWWTYEVESGEESTNWAIWGTYIETPGTYVVQVYWPESGEAEATTRARYRIYSEQNGPVGEVWVDQEAGGGEWYTLGVYDLPEGPAVVILTDWASGVPVAAERRVEQEDEPPRVYFDAVRWATPTPQATPTPTPTFTPTPTPTPTRTPTPAPTPTPRWGWWEAVEEATLQERSLQERVAYSRLLSRVRDEVMAPDPKGEAYIRLTYRYAPELTALLLEDAALRREVGSLLDEVRPLLEEMLARRERSSLQVSAGLVRRTDRVLEQIEGRAAPELRREIQWWRGWLPRFAGKTGWEVWQMLPVRSAEGWPAGGLPEEVVLRGLSRTDALAYGRLLSRVRDEVMLRERGGEVYVGLVYRYTLEVVGILLGDEGLREEAEALLVEVRPGLESLVGEGREWRFSWGWVERAEKLLEDLGEAGSPELRREMEWWQKRVRGWIGKTPQEVWQELLREPRVREALEPR